MGKFIVLTSYLGGSNGNLIVVNPDNIVSFKQTHNGTFVYMTHGPIYRVEESADRIMELINEDILKFV